MNVIVSSMRESYREKQRGQGNYKRKARWRARQRAERDRRPDRQTATSSLGTGSAQFRPLSALESAWTFRKCNAFMRARHYACDIMRDCIATRQSSSRHVQPCSPCVIRICERITTRRDGGPRAEETAGTELGPCLNLKQSVPKAYVPAHACNLQSIFAAGTFVLVQQW